MDDVRSISLPDDWEMRTVGSLGDVVTGTTPSTSHPEYYGGDVPFVCPADLDDKRFVDQTERRLTQEGAEKARLLPRNSVLVTCIGSLGKVGQAPMPLATNQQINSFIPYSEIDDHFAYWAMHTLQRRLEVEAGLQVVPIVNKSTFSKLPIPLPPLPEQDRIAEILDAADEAIRQSERVIAKLRLMKKGLLHDLLTRGLDAEGNLRNPEAHPEQFKDSPLGRIPREWNLWSLDALVEPGSSITYGVVKPGPVDPIDGVRFIRGGDFPRGEIQVDELRTITRQVSEQYQRALLNGGEVLVSLVGQPGSAAVVPSDLAGANIARQAAMVRPGDNLLPHFLKAYISSQKGFRTLTRDTLGSVQQVINLGDLRQLLVPVPPFEEQVDVVSILNAHDARIRAEEAALDKLRQVKRGLMDDLLTGRVRV